ncbi:hypothetical protein F53441_8976 [Fusarium austroafricanum]|uniref:Heterokaryon incompatibility domain-containing protein n=1 Tax=Fusarium austroafricanum TaxID=2364996 RepID=A0A8H4KBP9_9HYPO|nr:hypothetical protein F53441_8976 [Fusarium austroafricanum]
MEYKYDSLLPPGKIRLLTLLPGNHTVTTQLHVTNLEDNPTYKCLSYTWGDPGGDGTNETWSKPSEIILVEGFEMPIRRNLHNALTALRHSGTLGPIWIDALCINQENIEERNTQTAQMEKIYENAEEVIVWLGHEKDYTRTAVACFQRLPIITREELLSDDHVVMRDQAFAACNFSDSEMLDMTRFFTDHAWFGRTWTLQEMWLAREMTFVCGTVYASVDIILAGSSIAHDSYSSRSVTEDIQRTPAITWLMNFTYFDTISAVTAAHWEEAEGYHHMIEILNLALDPFPVKTLETDDILSVAARILTADQAGLYDYDSYDFVSQFGELAYCILWMHISKTNPDMAHRLLQNPASLSEALFSIGIENHADFLSGLLQPYSHLYKTSQQIELETQPINQGASRSQHPKTRTSSIRLDWGSASHKRCLFRTEKGHLGLAPQTIQVGDEVGILQGAQVPHVFYRDSDSEKALNLVSDAYVYGIMHGELESENLEFDWIKLV